MKLNVTTLEGKDAGSIELSDAIFGLDPRVEHVDDPDVRVPAGAAAAERQCDRASGG